MGRLFSTPRRALGGLLLGLCVLAGAGAAHAQAGAQTVPAARDALPAAVRDAGVLKVATSLQWPPFDFQGADGQPDGLDIRLVRLLAGKLGLKPQFDDVKFPAIVPGVSGGRYDIGVNQIGVTAERLKVVDFLNYYNSGYGLLVRQGVTDVDVGHLCGRTLVLTQGSAQVGLADALSADCVKGGQKAITFVMFPDSADTYLALANGRGDGFLTDRAVGVYIASKNPKLAMTSGMLPGRTLFAGVVIAKGNDALRTALRLALESAVADGSYGKLMAEFGVPDSALTVGQIRAPAPL